MCISNKISLLSLATICCLSLGIVSTTHAQSNNARPNNPDQAPGNNPPSGERPSQAPGVMGTITAIDGTNLTITTRGLGPNDDSGKTYTVDGSSAEITKNNTSATISDLAVDDMVMVIGTISDTTITATEIRQDAMPSDMPEQNRNTFGQNPDGSPSFGQGQPFALDSSALPSPEPQTERVGFFSRIRNFFRNIFHKD